jgi:hypothetical protein
MRRFLSCSSVLLGLTFLACSSRDDVFGVAPDASPSARGADAGELGPGGMTGMGGSPGGASVGGTNTGSASTAGAAGANTAGASGASDGGNTNTDGGTLPKPNPRRFRLATTGAQLVVTGPAPGLQLTTANVATDADVAAVHQEFYGVPWTELEAGQSPPAEWTALMQSLAAAAKSANKPVFLSVTMLNGQRERLAARTTIESGQVKTKDDTTAPCYDFGVAPDAASKRAAYLKYVELMVDTFHPAYLNVAVEVNLFFEKCAAAAPALRDVINAAYDVAKAKSPSTAVFPSIQIDHLYGYSKDSCPDQSDRDACFEAAYPSLAGIRRDRFAMSSYPYLSGITDPATLPADWFTRGAARGKETPLIAETGWLSTPLIAKAQDGTCPHVLDAQPSTEARYLGRVLHDAEAGNLDLVTWWSDRDLLLESVMTDCPCSADATWCAVVDLFRGPAVAGTDTQFLGEVLMKAFGSMGLRLYDGTPKPGVYPLWTAALSRPYARP